jgi:hypothetical protein
MGFKKYFTEQFANPTGFIDALCVIAKKNY